MGADALAATTEACFRRGRAHALYRRHQLQVTLTCGGVSRCDCSRAVGEFHVIFWVAVLCLASATAHAQRSSASAFVLSDDTLAGAPIGSFIDVLEDPSGQLAFSEVQKAPHAQRFERSRIPMLGVGFIEVGLLAALSGAEPRS